MLQTDTNRQMSPTPNRYICLKVATKCFAAMAAPAAGRYVVQPHGYGNRIPFIALLNDITSEAASWLVAAVQGPGNKLEYSLEMESWLLIVIDER